MRWRIVLLLLFLGFISAQLISAEAENISNSSSPSEDVSIAINSAGEIGAIWLEKLSGGSQHVYFSIRRNSQWSSPQSIPGQSGNNANPHIAKGVNSGFVAVWHDLAFDCIRFSQYHGSWSTPLTVSQVGGYQLGWPAVTTTTNGRIAVGWMRGNPTNLDIYVTTFQNGWSEPVNVANTAFSSKYCDLAYGPNGEIYVVFQDNLWINNTDFFATMICHDGGNGRWTQPEIVDNLNAWTFRPVMAVNASNDILSCFYYMQGSSYWAAYRQNGEWQSSQPISDFGDHHDHDFYFSDVCPYGNDGFLFIYRDCGYNIAYAVAQNGVAGVGVPLTNSFACYHPSIDFSPSLGAAAAWTDRSGNNDVFVAVFNPQDTSPPTTPPGGAILPPLVVEADYFNIPLAAPAMQTELIINRNLFTVQYFRKITWTFNANWNAWDISLAKYRVYRKLKTSTSWAVLAEVSPSLLLYIDKEGVSNEERFDYRVWGVDSLGNEFCQYNFIQWAPNPENANRKITVKGYNIYRKLSEQSSGSYILWKSVDAATNMVEDHSIEIRQQTKYDYALTAVSDKGAESAKAEAMKFSSSTRKARKE